MPKFNNSLETIYILFSIFILNLFNPNIIILYPFKSKKSQSPHFLLSISL